MPTDAVLGTHRIEVEADLSLQDLLAVGKTYSQLYTVLYPLQEELTDTLRGEGADRLEYLYRAFPWRGGYSAVNFYESQRFLLPPRSRPSIRRVRIESPGFMDLGVAVAAAYSVQHIVKATANVARNVGSLYQQIYKEMHERKLMRINARREELALAREQLEFAEDAHRRLGEALDLKESDRILELADNPLAALKISLSLYRRARLLSKAEERDKIELQDPRADNDK